MKFLRILGLILGVSLVLGIGVYIYYTRYSTHLYINPIEYDEFKKSVPVSTDVCKQGDDINYYYYEDIPENEQTNNKFGLYIYPDNEKFVQLADELVNSNGGDWGYVLIPYNVQDADEEKWQRLFFLLHKKHLIPIVQLWNIDPDAYEEETEEAAEFLNKFLWPTKQRYISAYNEPNDAGFWYDRVDPAEYARILDETIDVFNATNEDFFVINGALNITAPNSSRHMDAFDYMVKMDEEIPGIFNKLEGWASHSYPQPNFSGSPSDIGRDSIRGYDEELKFLKERFNVEKELPIFITETGWAHSFGRDYDPSFLSVSQVAQNIKEAYEKVWLPDNRVKAVTPFTIWYEAPADHFAWVDHNWTPYEHFQEIKGMKKPKGNPEKLANATVSSLGCENN